MAESKEFSLALERFIEKAKGNVEQVVRKVGVDLLTNVVLRTPVGNPELWASNQSAQYIRKTHNIFVEAINTDILTNPNNRTKSGRLKNGVRATLLKRKSKSDLAAENPISKPDGYVGGRLRANWYVSINLPTSGETDGVDPSGSETISRGTSIINEWAPGDTAIYITNNLPYAIPVEYGHSSKQAPSGMVRITTTEFQAYVAKAAREVNK